METLAINNINFNGVLPSPKYKPNRKTARVVTRLYQEVSSPKNADKKGRTIRDLIGLRNYDLIYDNGPHKGEINVVLEKTTPWKYDIFKKFEIGSFSEENIDKFAEEFKLRLLEEKSDRAGMVVGALTGLTMMLMILLHSAAESRKMMEYRMFHPQTFEHVEKAQKTGLKTHLPANTIHLNRLIKL